MKAWILTVAALLLAGPATAQEWLVNREQFRYIGTRLTIEVATDAPGTLQIIRGQPGVLRVAGRATSGFAASGLSRHDRLTLSAMAGGGPVNYLVSVPEGVWVNIRLPDRYGSESMGGHTAGGTFDWGAARARETAASPADAPAAAYPPAATGDQRSRPDRARPDAWAQTAADAYTAPHADLFTVTTAELAPASIALPRPDVLRKLTVRTGADRFRVSTSRPMSLRQGDGRSMVIRPTEVVDIAIDVPAGTRDLTISLGNATALSIRNGEPSSLCTPVTQQWLSGGRRWFTFSPLSARLACQPAPARHEG